jgi:two-component system, OmpR family, response regulator
MARVLVIEDDQETAAGIVENLTVYGHEVVHAATGPEGLELATGRGFDVITVDCMLPGLDGIALVETLRRTQISTPILMLSALSALDERVLGLRAGGDDYLTKPFAYAELRARVDALLRRSPEPRETVLRVGDLEIDLLTRSARRGTRVLDITPRELRLLEYLVRHAGHAVTRAMLFEEVWNYRFDPHTNLVDVHVGRLRRALEAPGEPPMLQSVRGVGFRLDIPQS